MAVVGIRARWSAFAGAEASSVGIVVADVSTNVVGVEGVVITVDVSVVRVGGGAQVSSRGVVGCTGVERSFASCGLTHPVGPDLDALCLGTTGASRKFLVDVVDEAVQVLPLRGGRSGCPRIWVSEESIWSKPVAEEAGGPPGTFYPVLEMQRNVAGIEVMMAVNEPQFAQLSLELAEAVDVDS